MMSIEEKYKVDIPEGKIGVWSVEKFTVSERESDLNRLRGLLHSGRFVRPGTYTKLMRGNTLVMSDTSNEIRDHLSAIYKSSGHCLIVGLGLGLVTKALLDKPEVTKVTVVEKSEEVIKLVGEYLLEKYPDKLEIICADIFTWKAPKGAYYQVAWFDIWDYICADNLPEMSKLKRKFGSKASWKGCWCEYSCRRGR
jgi:spermidine synthase